MGNSAAGRLTATYFGTSATALGAAGGAQSHTLTAAEIPTITSSGTAGSAVAPANNYVTSTGTEIISFQGGATNRNIPFSSSLVVNSSGASLSGVTTSSSNTGGGAHATSSPMMLATIYLKL
jgi:hypothetical protein